MTLKQAKHSSMSEDNSKKSLRIEEEELREQISELREEQQGFCECEAPLVRGYGDDEYCGLCQKRFTK